MIPFLIQHFNTTARNLRTRNFDKLNFHIKIDMLATQILSVYKKLISGLRATNFQTSVLF